MDKLFYPERAKIDMNYFCYMFIIPYPYLNKFDHIVTMIQNSFINAY